MGIYMTYLFGSMLLTLIILQLNSEKPQVIIKKRNYY